MILEGIVTTTNDDGTTNISPMGPIVDESMQRLQLRPFASSQTYRNLQRQGEGVFHVTDDVLMLAQAAVGQLDPPPRLAAVPGGGGQILLDACRWYAFRVERWRETEPRGWAECRVVQQGRLRDVFGFNRAKHAVLEAAILATRVHFLPADEIVSQMKHLAVLVEKTAGPHEQQAFEFLWQYVHASLPVDATGGRGAAARP